MSTESTKSEKSQFIPPVNCSVLKLKTGETLFCETNNNPTNNRFLDVSDPFLVRTIELADNTESLYAAKWIPFTAYTKFSIPVDSILALAPLNRSYRHFYGLTFLKAELYDMNNITVNRVARGEPIKEVLADMLPKMDALFNNSISRFGSLEFDMVGFKKFVETSVENVKSANFNFEAFEKESEDEESKPILH